MNSMNTCKTSLMLDSKPFNAEVSIVIRKKYLKCYVYKEDEIDN